MWSNLNTGTLSTPSKVTGECTAHNTTNCASPLGITSLQNDNHLVGTNNITESHCYKIRENSIIFSNDEVTYHHNASIKGTSKMVVLVHKPIRSFLMLSIMAGFRLSIEERKMNKYKRPSTSVFIPNTNLSNTKLKLGILCAIKYQKEWEIIVVMNVGYNKDHAAMQYREWNKARM